MGVYGKNELFKYFSQVQFLSEKFETLGKFVEVNDLQGGIKIFKISDINFFHVFSMGGFQVLARISFNP